MQLMCTSMCSVSLLNFSNVQATTTPSNGNQGTLVFMICVDFSFMLAS